LLIIKQLLLTPHVTQVIVLQSRAISPFVMAETAHSCAAEHHMGGARGNPVWEMNCR